jgi:hypothetical protein
MLVLKNPSAQAGPRPLKKYTFEERYKQFRNLLRRYNLESIVYEAIRHTATPPDNVLEDLQRVPWLAMLIAKWALADKMVAAGHGPAITTGEFEGLMQQLWSFEGDLHPQGQGAGTYLLLRRISAVQVAFQARNTRAFLRIPMLLTRRPENYSLRLLFQQQWGMPPDHFVDLAICLYSARQYMHDPVIDRSAFAPLEAVYGANAIDRMLGEFSRSVPDLRTELITMEKGNDGKSKPRRRSELNEFPVFQWLPLLLRPDGRYVVWHPTVMAKALEMAVHLRFSKAGQEYINAFSSVFEDYVIELAASLGGPCHTERDMVAQLGNKSKVVEALLPFVKTNVLIEAKMGLFPDTMMTLSDPVIAGDKLANLVKAVTQGAAVCEALHTGRLVFADTVPSETNYLLVITSRDLSIGRASVLDSMCQPNGVRYDSEIGQRLLPLEHIFYVSIEAFEAIVAAVRLGKITLPEFLAHAVTRNRDPQTASLWLDLQLPNGARNLDDPESAIAQAWEAAARRLEQALDAPGLTPFELKTT